MPIPNLTAGDLGEFSLARYDALRTYTTAQWQQLVAHRSALWELVNDPGPSEKTSSDLGGVAKSALWRQLAADPLGTAPLLLGPWAVALSVVPDEYAGPIPADPMCPDAQAFGMLDDVPLGQFHRNGSTGRRLVHLELDMDLNNAALIRCFAAWLSLYRELHNESTVNTSAIVRAQGENESTKRMWLREKLIPYIDLQLAAKLLDRNPADALIRGLLYPGGSQDEWLAIKHRLKRHQKSLFGYGGLQLMLASG